MKRLLERLTEWMRANGFTDEQISACIAFITKQEDSHAENQK